MGDRRDGDRFHDSPSAKASASMPSIDLGRSGGRRVVVTLPLPPSLARLQARVMELLPGKPFSMDNFHSLSIHNICDSDAPGLKALGIRSSRLETVLGRYIGPSD